MLRWFDDLAVQGILTTDDDAGDQELEPPARGAQRPRRGGRRSAGRCSTSVPDLVSRGLDVHYRAALTGEAARAVAPLPPLPHRLASAAARERAERADCSARGGRRHRRHHRDRRGRERARRERARDAPPDRRRGSGARAWPRRRCGSRTSSWRRCRTRSARRSTPCSAGRKILLGRQVDPAMLTRALQVIDRNAVGADAADRRHARHGAHHERQAAARACSRSIWRASRWRRSTSSRRRPTREGDRRS